MKIIGISGGSGAGKSTVSKRLVELLPNAMLINGDLFMHEESNRLEDEIFKKLNIKKDKDIFSYNYYFESFDNVKVWVDTIRGGVITKAKSQIENEGKDKEYIIFDWVFLPMCEYINECDHTICVKTDFERRRTRLTKRLQDKTIYNDGDRSFWSYKPGSIERRLRFTELDELGYISDFEVRNDGDLEVLFQNIEDIVDEIRT